MKDERRNYVIAGMFVLAMLAGLIAWIAILSGRTGATDDFVILYDNVMGLAGGTVVRYEGYPIGHIKDIEPTRVDGKSVFRVHVAIQRGWPILADDVAEIVSPGLLSAFVLDIHGGTPGQTVKPGGQIQSREAVNVFAVLNEVAEQLTDLVENGVKPLFNDLAQSSPEILGNVEKFTSQINHTVDRVNRLLNDQNTGRIDQILLNLERTSDSAADLITGLRDTLETLDSTLDTAQSVLSDNQDEVREAVLDLQRTLAAVARHIDAISANLEDATRSASEFAEGIRRDPSLILRGREVGADPAAQ
jgi:phospholipid/cholesterol/gamma-HCH transport system substrate-binding protein